ncbi:trypsin eta-like [Cochliomyia hominivorax]
MSRIILLTVFCLIAIGQGISLVNAEGRIIGGREVSISKHPYQVSIRRKTCATCAYLHACGGRPIVFIRADGYIARVKEIVIHENYQPALSKNDIALLILNPSLPLNDLNTQPASLADEEPKADSLAVVSGWGYTSESGECSLKLQEVEVNIIDRIKCNATYGYDRIEESMICAGSALGGKDACQYDSGGPLIANNKLIGIVSWGTGCARPEYPGVYVNVFYFKNWIENLAKINNSL